MPFTLDNLFSAIDSENHSLVLDILNSNPDYVNLVREDDYYKQTPLTYTSYHGKTGMCMLLIEAGADINGVNIYGLNCLLASIGNLQFKTANYLLELEGLDLAHESYSGYDAFGQIFKTVQHYGTRNESDEYTKDLNHLIDSMLDKGFDINRPQKLNDTPLLLAAKSQSWPIVGYLIGRGADYTKKDFMECDIWNIFCANRYLPPEWKERYVERLLDCVKHAKEKYGPLAPPKDLYIEHLSGEKFEFGS